MMDQQRHEPSEISDAVASDGIDLLVKSSDEVARHTQRGRRHSLFVRLLRLVLPVLAIAVVAVLWSWSGSEEPLAPVPRAAISPQTVQSNELINPKFQSEDSQNRPYTITADKATQNAANKNVIVLEKPVADMALPRTDGGQDGWVALKAQQGEYAQDSGKLHLSGDVEMHHNSGYELSTQSMDIDVTSQTLSTDQPVSGQGPAGHITAQGFDAYGERKTIIFEGPVKLIMRPQLPPKESPDEQN